MVGFTMDRVEVRLSNLMAFDARAIGNWGCEPAHYPAIVDKVLTGAIDVVTPTEIRPPLPFGHSCSSGKRAGVLCKSKKISISYAPASTFRISTSLPP